MSQPLYFDRVQESSTTTGVGTYTLAGALAGYQPFSIVGDGNVAYYVAVGVDGAGVPNGGWEVGLGTYTLAGTLLARTAILTSSNANAAVNWAAGTRRISLVQPAAQLAIPFRRVITHAELLASPITALPLTMTPPANWRVRLLSVSSYLSVVTTTYGNIHANATCAICRTNATSGTWEAQGPINDSTIAVTPLADLTAWLGGAVHDAQVDFIPTLTGIQSNASGSRLWVVYGGPPFGGLASVTGLPLVFSINNQGAGALTLGNAANYLIFEGTYRFEKVIP